MTRTRLFAVATILLAMPLLAADLGKYKDWDQSPQGYFMTKAEHEQWKAVASEADAEKFVNEFLAKRDAGFADEVKKRAEMADKYLTLSNTPGSKSLRGKVIVLFGPPSAMDVANRTKTSTKRDNPLVSDAISNSGSIGSGGGGGRGNDSPTNLGASMSTAQGIRTYTITFSGDATTKTIDKPSVTFVIEADASTGKDGWASRSAGKEAEDLFELMARYSIKK